MLAKHKKSKLSAFIDDGLTSLKYDVKSVIYEALYTHILVNPGTAVILIQLQYKNSTDISVKICNNI